MNRVSNHTMCRFDYHGGSTVLCSMSEATFELYEDSANEWRWRLRHRNTEIIADSGEGYSSERTARNGIESVKRTASEAPVETDD